MQKTMFFMVLIFCSFYFCSDGICQKIYGVRQLKSAESIQLNGNLTESSWRARVTPLELLEKYEISDTTWVSTCDPAFPAGIIVNWQAVWKGDTIYIGIEVEDNVFDHDNYQNDSPNYANIQNDDGVHIFWDNQKNVRWANRKWTWPDPSTTQADSNYLIHSFVQDSYFVQLGNNEIFRQPTFKPGSLFNFEFPHPPTATKWSIETAISSDSGSFKVGDSIWVQITYNDADTEFDPVAKRIIRERRLAWNILCDHVEPWNQPGLLVLKGYSDVEVYEVADNASLKKIVVDGAEDKLYQSTAGATLATARSITPGTPIIWSRWPNYNDAFIIMHALSDFSQHRLYLLFKVFDDFKNTIPLISPDKLVNDDGLLLWIDYDNDKSFMPLAQDINVLIRNTGTMHKINAIGEMYDTTAYFDDRINLKTQSFGPGLKNWIAEIELHLPPNIKQGDTLSIDFGYNDADFDAIREHQLVWSTSDTNATPWRNYNKLGKFILTGDPVTSVSPPTTRNGMPVDFQLYPNYPNPFNHQTNIKFSLEKNCHVTIAIYDLLGRRVTTLVDDYYRIGTYQIQWDARNNNQNAVASGIYFVTMAASDFKKTQKMAFIR